MAIPAVDPLEVVIYNKNTTGLLRVRVYGFTASGHRGFTPDAGHLTHSDLDSPGGLESCIDGHEALPAGVQSRSGRLVSFRPGATVAAVARDLGVNPRRCAAGSGPMTNDVPAPTRRPRQPRRPSRFRARWKARTPHYANGSASWRRTARSCVRRRSISPGRRAGEEPSINYCLRRSCCRTVRSRLSGL